MGNISEFRRAVRLVIDNVSFEQNTTVQVFEANIRYNLLKSYQVLGYYINIRLLGGLLSAHLLIKDDQMHFGDIGLKDYENELLDMAHDLANRLLPAFENTRTGIPHPRVCVNLFFSINEVKCKFIKVHLTTGIPLKGITETCTAGAGTLLVEFGILSRLIRDPIYESYARRAVRSLWGLKNKDTGLLGIVCLFMILILAFLHYNFNLGNTVDIQTGHWTGQLSGIGAGMDSYYEYLLKSFILFGEEEDLDTFYSSYETIKAYQRKG